MKCKILFFLKVRNLFFDHFELERPSRNNFQEERIIYAFDVLVFLLHLPNSLKSVPDRNSDNRFIDATAREREERTASSIALRIFRVC